MTMMDLDYSRLSFNNLEEEDTKTLSSALEVIIQDPSIKKIYLGKDREALYSYVSPLFETLKTKYGISHWYFILPDGHVFLRAHSKDIYGDEVDRLTFLKAKDTNNVASGIELGKTAYALRVVIPYYNNGKLIGYVELGEEIEHFLKILKGETANEFSIIADKKFLSRGDWASVRQVAGLRDNWDDIAEHVVVADTAESELTAECFTEKNLELVEKGDDSLQQIQDGNKIYKCVGFGLADAKGQHNGSILALIDVTTHVGVVNKANQLNAVFSFIVLVITVIFSILLSSLLSYPIKKLTQVSQSIAQGNLNARVDIKSKDEIGVLAQNFNQMADTLLESQKLPKNILRSMKDSLFVVDTKGNITEVNNAALQVLGYKKEELVGRPISAVFGRTKSIEALREENTETTKAQRPKVIQYIPAPGQEEDEEY